MRRIRKVLFSGVILLACIGSSNAFAQKELGVFNTFSVGASVGSTGIGVDVAAPITPRFALRGGVSFMPGITFDANVNVVVDDLSLVGEDPIQNVDVKGDIGRTSGELLVNYYPFNKGTFFVTAGAYFGGSKIVRIEGHSDVLKKYVDKIGSASIVIGGNTIPVDKNGDVTGGLKVAGFRPYVGLGFGRAVPKNRIGCMFELGVQFHGTAKVYSATGDLGESGVEVEMDDDFTKIINKVKVYPVLKFRICGRIL